MCKLSQIICISFFLLFPLTRLAAEPATLRPSEAGEPALLESRAPAPDSGTVDYFPVLPLGAGPSTQPSLIPLAVNHALESNHAGITRAVILIHDAYRDAAKGLSVLRSLAGPEDATTIFIAPQFLLESDLTLTADDLPEKGRMFVRWSFGSWEQGGDSIILSGPHGISSFTVLDLLVLFLAEKKNFPDLKQIVVVGQAEGGSYVQRYLAVGRALEILSGQMLEPHFIVANPPSFLYFTPSRFRGEKFGFGSVEPEACPLYNSWPYGLDELNSYARRKGANAAKTQYAERHVTYLLGMEIPFKKTVSQDTECARQLQGSDVATRAAIYEQYLKGLYGENVTSQQQFVTVPQAGNDLAALLGSSCAMAILFGDGDCHDKSFKGAKNSQQP